MAEFPALPLFTDAYLADTRHLTTEEHGAYLLLLICAWRSRACALRDNDKTLARITGLSPARWRRMKPALIDFFEIEGGYWRQKKLTSVYEGVAVRVARNRMNGAKGGRASRTARLAAKNKAEHKPQQTGQEGESRSETGTKTAPAKTITKTIATGKAGDKPAAAGVPVHDDGARWDAQDHGPAFDTALWRQTARHACGSRVKMDEHLLQAWHAMGVDMTLDMVPTLKAVTAREIARSGAPPRLLAYYREAVIDAMKMRREQAAATQALMDQRARKIAFDRTCTDHWLQLLGDPDSAFRGDYMARHWYIPGDHPVFRPAALGPNPRLVWSNVIPASIYKRYGRCWQWLTAAAR